MKEASSKFFRILAASASVFFAAAFATEAVAENTLSLDLEEGLKALDETGKAQQKVATSLAESVVEDATGVDAIDDAEELAEAAKKSGEFAPQKSGAAARPPTPQNAAIPDPSSAEFASLRLENARQLKRAADGAAAALAPYAPALYDVLRFRIAGASVACLAGAAMAAGGALAAQKYLVDFFIRLAARPFRPVSREGVRELLERIRGPLRALIMLLGLHTALALALSNKSLILLAGSLSGVALVAIIFWGIEIFAEEAADAASARLSPRYPAARDLARVAKSAMRWVFASVCVFVGLAALGVNVGALIATLAVGGAALAFASKDTIANFLGGMAIIIDRPFEVGDTIKSGSVEGVVSRIGSRSTRIRTGARTVVTVPNSILASNPVNNLSKESQTAFLQTISISGSMDPAGLEALVKSLSDGISGAVPDAPFPPRVVFSGFGHGSFELSVKFCVPSADPEKAEDGLERANFAIARALKSSGARLAGSECGAESPPTAAAAPMQNAQHGN